jgi:hypothetical protein
MKKLQFEPFIIEYDPITSPILSFIDESTAAAVKAISTNHDDLPVVVMMSGGIDSELVGDALLHAHIPFQVVIGRLRTDVVCENTIFNMHDYQVAERWCLKNNIDIIYCDIDIYQLSTVLCKYALESYGFSPQFACHMYIMKWCTDNGLFFLAGNGELNFVRRDDGKYYMMDSQRAYTLNNFCKIYKCAGVCQFWKQDARVAAAFLQLPTVKWFMSEGVDKLLDHKHACFADVFEFEPRIKLTGFEYVLAWDSHLRNPMKIVMGKYDAVYYTALDHFTFTSSFVPDRG